MTEPIHDLARIGHAELLTPKPDESLRFFVDVLGMEEEARDGQSVYLRGWGDYLRYSLKLTESPQAGLGHVALRAWSPEALDRRVAADRGDGTRARLDRRRRRPRSAPTASRIPTGTSSSSTTRPSATTAPEHLRPSWRNQPQRYVGRGAAVKRLDHVNVLAADVRANRVFAQEVLGYRLYERIELDDGTETGAWLSLSIAAHELIYVADAYGAGRPAPPPRVLGRHARGVPARGRHLRRRGRPHRGGALEARGRAGLLPLRVRAGRQPDRGDDRRLLRLRPGLRADRLDGGRSARAASSGACRRSRARCSCSP